MSVYRANYRKPNDKEFRMPTNKKTILKTKLIMGLKFEADESIDRSLRNEKRFSYLVRVNLSLFTQTKIFCQVSIRYC